MTESKFETILSKVPSHVSLDHAFTESGDGEDDPPKRVSIILQFSESGFGFGEIVIIQTPAGVFIDTERTSLDRVKRYMNALLDSAILDTDQDPERHALFNKERGQWCGKGCVMCYPPDKETE
jgi:hypothetical protein